MTEFADDAMTTTAAGHRGRFWRIATAGIFVQGGAAAVDTSTIVAALLPLAGTAIAEATSFSGVFAVSLAAAILQYLAVRRLRTGSTRGPKR